MRTDSRFRRSWRRWRDIVWRTVTRSLKDDIVIYGGYAAYTSLLAFFPFIIFLMATAGMLGSTEISQRILHYGLTYLPKDIADAVVPVIRSLLQEESPGLLTLGSLGTLWVASSGVEGLRFGLNIVYSAGEFRPLWKRRLQSMALVIAGAVIFLLLALIVILWPLVASLFERLASVSLEKAAGYQGVRLLLAAGMLMLLFGTLYRVLPNRTHALRDIWPGALLATVLWLALAQLFSFYLANFGRYDVTYGTIGGVIITLIFFHLSATVILLGAEFNRAIRSD